MKFGLGFALSCAMMATGCATVTRGTNDVFEVNTVPSQAQVTTTNGYSCVTPCALKMPRRSEFDVTISKAGYRTAQAHVTNAVGGEGGVAMAGNVLVGGLIGAGVDAGTGAMLDLKPNPLNVTLEQSADRMEAIASSAPIQATVAAVQQRPTAAPAETPATPTPVAAAESVALPELAPLPTQTTKLPGHRVAGHGCPGFAPRVLYAESPSKLPATCEQITPL